MSTELSVSKYILNYNFTPKYKVTTKTISSFNANDDLRNFRSVAGANVCGKLTEMALCALIDNPKLSLNELITQINTTDVLLTQNIYNYLKEVVKTLNLKKIETQKKYSFKINDVLINACPDIVADNGIYDIKVVNKSDSNTILKQMYLYYHGYSINFNKLLDCTVINLYTNTLTTYSFEKLSEIDFTLKTTNTSSTFRKSNKLLNVSLIIFIIMFAIIAILFIALIISIIFNLF